MSYYNTSQVASSYKCSSNNNYSASYSRYEDSEPNYSPEPSEDIEQSASDEQAPEVIVESGLYHLPSYLTTRRVGGLKWNVVQFQRSWTKENQSFFTTMEELIRLDAIYKDFTRSALLNAKLLVEELFRSGSGQRTLNPAEMGGRAGGTKFVRDSIFFKFNLDSEDIYGGAFLGFKAGRRELANSTVLYDLFYPKYHFLSVPLFANIDYCGYLISCVGLLPLKGNDGLCYGSADGGKTVLKSDEIAQHIEELAEKLNLAPHLVTEAGDVIISHCADIEVHKGTDDNYYMLDTARLMPPEFPTAENPRSIFYYTLRPEFVAKYPVKLCADGLSGFMKWDPNRGRLNEELKKATQYLIDVVVPAAAKELDELCLIFPASRFHVELSVVSGKLACRYRPTPKIDMDVNIPAFLHARGINLRHLGLLYQHLKTTYWKEIILNYIYARVAKNTLKLLWKRTIEEMDGVSKEALNRSTIEFLNLLLGRSEETTAYWEDEFTKSIFNSYFSKASIKRKLISMNFSFLAARNSVYILNHLDIFFGVSFYSGTHQALTDSGNPFSDSTFNPVLPDLCKMNYFGISFNMVRFSNVFAFCNREDDGSFGFKLIGDNSEVRSAFLREMNNFLEDSMVNILSGKKPISRNPDILYTEILFIAKLFWTAANLPTPRENAMTRKSQYDDDLNREKRRGLFYLAYFLKDLIFEKMRTILDNPSHSAIIREKHPNGLATILKHVEECLAVPCPPPNFLPSVLGHRYLMFYTSHVIIKLLKLRLFVNEKNYIAASQILDALYIKVMWEDKLSDTLISFNQSLYKFSNVTTSCLNFVAVPEASPVFYLLERHFNMEYAVTLIRLYQFDSIWNRARLLFLIDSDRESPLAKLDPDFRLSLLRQLILRSRPILQSANHYARMNMKSQLHEHRIRFAHESPIDSNAVVNEICSHCGGKCPHGGGLPMPPINAPKQYVVCTQNGCDYKLCMLCLKDLEDNDLVNRHLPLQCTYKITGESENYQELYNCGDCDVGTLCYACLKTCHVGHDVSFPVVQLGKCACHGSGFCKLDHDGSVL